MGYGLYVGHILPLFT